VSRRGRVGVDTPAETMDTPLAWLEWRRWWRVLAALWLLQATNVRCTDRAGGSKQKPEITEPVPNVTVAVGRDATLKCFVKHLDDYKVAWVHIDRQMILTIGRHVITRIPRFAIQHDNHHTWTLHVKDVAPEDRGYYMCQVNTDPMISVTGHLDVVVPPNIVDEESSSSSVSVRENHNASLVCRSTGVPQPKIAWRREDGGQINQKKLKKAKKTDMAVYNGEVLDLFKVSRTQMGAYLCIASNKVPPSVSKRITLVVEFAPMIWIPNQLVGAPKFTQVSLECHTEASPKAITYWVYNDVMILKSTRHETREKNDGYKLHSELRIKNITMEDFGAYRCVSKNSLGETEGTIRLYEMDPQTTTGSYIAPTEVVIQTLDRENTIYDQPYPEDNYEEESSRNQRKDWRNKDDQFDGRRHRQEKERRRQQKPREDGWSWPKKNQGFKTSSSSYFVVGFLIYFFMVMFHQF